MAELLGQRDLRRGAHDAVHAKDGVDHVLQVLVGAGHDATVEVSRSRGRMRFEHLWDAGEVRRDVDETTLGDLQRDEGEHVVAERPQVEVGAEAGDDPSRPQLVEPRLRGAASDVQAARQLHDAGARRLRQRQDESRVEAVDAGGQHVAHHTNRGRSSWTKCPASGRNG